MRGSNNVRKYLGDILRAGNDAPGTADYRSGVVSTLEWMLGNQDARPIVLEKKPATKKAAATGKPQAAPKRVRAPRKRTVRAYPKDQQVHPAQAAT